MLPQSRIRPRAAHGAAGFSLVELMIVVALISILAAYIFSSAAARRESVGGAERVLEQVSLRLHERHDAAKRLNAIAAPTSLENFTAPPIVINFLNSESTRTLVTDGVDADDDGIDDYTGSNLTTISRPTNPGGVASWSYAYQGLPLSLPAGWRVVRRPDDLGSVPLIYNGERGQGVLTTAVAFDAQGRALVAGDDGGWQSLPEGAGEVSADPAAAPFWAIYFISSDNVDNGTITSRRSTPLSVTAIAVHPTGQLERWRWNGSTWEGFARRTDERR